MKSGCFFIAQWLTIFLKSDCLESQMSNGWRRADFPNVRGVLVGDSLLKWAELPGFVYVQAPTTSHLKGNVLEQAKKHAGRDILIVCCGSNDLRNGSRYEDIVSNIIEFKNEVTIYISYR